MSDASLFNWQFFVSARLSRIFNRNSCFVCCSTSLFSTQLVPHTKTMSYEYQKSSPEWRINKPLSSVSRLPATWTSRKSLANSFVGCFYYREGVSTPTIFFTVGLAYGWMNDLLHPARSQLSIDDSIKLDIFLHSPASSESSLAKKY